ncbi:MAG: galactose-1-phosphate uridylyltransferase [Planctomycetota bacterium]|nr:galactose-1-phosphate uridylyltransferase [Planctomycetota bacterium]
MPELRKDPLSLRWVIIATERAKRPSDFRPEPEAKSGGFCPFCAGNEDKTPPEIAAYRERGSERNGAGWRVRVVPNKFPALQIEGSLNKKADGIYDWMQGVGAHEVIIESPQHVTSYAGLPEPAVQEIFWMYRDRLLDLKRDRRLKYGMLFKNVGLSAGASLEHTHSQLIVTPIVPRTVNFKISSCREYYRYHDRCLVCDMVQQELAQRSRVVMETEEMVAFEPYAPRFPFETWVMPKAHASHFENMQRKGIEELARTMKEVLLRLQKALNDPPYNYMVYTAPFDAQEMEEYHWHIEIIPRLTRVAGFEWGTGFYINPVPPESAAAYLRETAV